MLSVSTARSENLTDIPGQWADRPYVLLGTYQNPIIAFKIRCYKYDQNVHLDSTTTKYNRQNSIPERISYNLIKEKKIKDKIRLLTKCESDNYSFLLFQVGSDNDYTIEQLFFKKKGNKYKLLKNIDTDSLFVKAISAHPFIEDPFIQKYDEADIEGMDVWSTGQSKNSVHMYLRLHPERYRILSSIAPESPQLNRLLTLAGTRDLSQFVNIYSKNLYPYIFDLYSQNPNHLQPFMSQLNHSNDIRILREIIG
ncbi:MAG: hypothetical protein D3913_13265, partial [Candidatus Electrothrix sp. LOE1_4_5]|nr:hypothetical protein [Candidatus Electrothrix gigas]